ncbi:21037_t:CDS:2, partial [Cetraspora pellucida]
KDFDHDWKIVKDLYKNSTFKYIHDKEAYNDFKLVTRGNFSNKEVTKYDILGISTLDYPCAPIMANPNYRKWFKKKIPDYGIFTAISLKLLRVHPDIRNHVENFASNNFGDYNIGIHIREKKPPAGMILPVEHYYHTVKMLMLGIEKKDISIFVAADTNDGRNKLVNLLREEFKSRNNSIKIVQSEDNMNMANTVSLNMGSEVGALIDMKLLSLCDDLVLSYSSSFGFTAAGWSHKASRQRGPFVVMPIKDSQDDLTEVDKVWVWGATSSEPCMYMSKSLINNEDEKTVQVFKKRIYYHDGEWSGMQIRFK